MNLFHTLHRIYTVSWAAVVVAFVIWLYPRTGLSAELVDWYAVWDNKSDVTVRPVADVSGTVVQVNDGTSFRLRTPDRLYYSIGLLGALPPLSAKPTAQELERARLGKARLSELVLSNEVQVTLTWVDATRRGIGVAHFGPTNVNAAMVESGLVQFKKKFIKGLPLWDQFALLRADRRAREQRTDHQE